ncbi:protein kinase [Paenibacillus lupini]|uniref:serine/threonine protein kinase n=1 Tax=Paenibacillus lupini TaxID=1450204 RepID=UPI00141FEB8D|nr:protein kinase [Paenibacillus lupini]NIK23058.1 serine/threonine-protein kinase [Paenibacillus lupini]
MDYPLRPGVVWAGQYRIEQFLGMGSYGQTYRCTDLKNGTAVLLKRAKPSKREIGRRLLKRESEILQQLNHPQIPAWLDWAVHRREQALVMAYVEGEDMEQAILLLGRTYTEQEAMLLILGLLRPLQHLHEAGYVHRDVRIPNVLLKNDKVHLIDLGLACRTGEEDPSRREGEPSGFADSWGPIKYRMRMPDPTSDLYGLGHIFLFLMYAGYSPEEGQEERSWEEELSLQPRVKSWVKGLFESKWRTAVECEQELAHILADYSAGNNE